MARKTGFVIVLSLALMPLAGCASKPTQPTQPMPPPYAGDPDSALAQDRRFQEIARGYKAVRKEGRTVYCRSEKEIGSTISTTHCYTESQLRSTAEANEATRRRMRQGTGG